MMDEAEMIFDKDASKVVTISVVDQNNPAETNCVTIPQEYYDRILSGQSTLKKDYDEEGNIQFVLIDEVQTESKESLDTLHQVINNTTNLHSISHDNDDQLHNNNANFNDDIHSHKASLESNLPEDQELKDEEYLITEYPSEDGYCDVIMVDTNGITIYHEKGRIGDTVILDLCGHSISYPILGPNEDGSFRQTNVIINQTDNDAPEPNQEDLALTSETEINETQPIQESTGEEYVITEETIMMDNMMQQEVRFTDKNSNVLKTQYGMKGSKVKFTLTDKAFEYEIQGPSDTGEPIITCFAINNDDDVVEDKEAEDPAVQWCPNDVSKEDYDVIRNAARQIATAPENTKDQPPIQPYSEELGSMSAYKDLVSLVDRYKSHIEERQQDLQLLRRHSKIYLPAKASARKLTKHEHIKNEAAAQICRYIPTLLFHKRRLNKYVEAVIEASGLIPVQDKVNDTNRPFTGPGPIIEDEHQSNMIVPMAPATRPQSSNPMANINNYMTGDISRDNNFNQPFSFGKRDLQLTINEENAIKMAADRLQDELYQYPFMASNVECKQVEDLQGLQAALNSGDNLEVERAHEYMRKESALSGRLTSLPRRTLLSPYDVAVNEAAYLLVRNNIGLLTHEKTLLDLARKVVRASGCSFRQNALGDKKEYSHNGNMWLNNQDTVPELDLSCAVHVLSDSLEDGPSQALSFVPAIEETAINSDSGFSGDEDDDEDVYRPKEFRDKELLGNFHLECESERNILNECVIYSHTGTDNLKKVRILDLQHCSFTSIMPIDINQCCNLVELNLANSALSYLPRCLFLPNLCKLNIRNNRFVTVPLLEQFAKLSTLEIDDKVARKLNTESLSFFCPELRLINNRKFEGVISDDFNDIFTEAKSNIESMVQNRWEEDLAMFFKNGVTKSESQKVIETLVIGVRSRKVINEEKFTNFKDLIARRVAESFLESKITDDYDDDEYKEKASVEVNSDDDEEDNEESMHPRSMYQRKNEFDNQTVEKGQILLNDEPLDRLTNVVGQALRCGKTVVYSVMRTAARQPGGDLIPVGGGDSNQKSNYLLSSAAAAAAVKKHISEDYGSCATGGGDSAPRIRPGPASYLKRKYGIEQTLSDTDNDTDLQHLIDTVMDRVESFNNRKRIGRPKTVREERPPKIRRTQSKDTLIDENLFKIPKTVYEDDEVGLIEYDILDQIARTNEKLTPQQTVQRIEEIIEACRQPVTPQQFRKILGQSLRGRASAQIMAASNRTYKKHNQEPPEPVYQVKPARTTEWTLDTQYEHREHLSADTGVPLPRMINESTLQMIGDTTSGGAGATDVDDSVDMMMMMSGAEDMAVSPTVQAPYMVKDKYKAHLEQLVARAPLSVPLSLPLQPRPVGDLVVLTENAHYNEARTTTAVVPGPKIPDYDPLHFIRCHALDNNPQDCTTKVWRCAFEPSLSCPYLETTASVATCGGECVCLIDCASGKVKKRFKSKEEEFYCVAWTTLEIAPGHWINVLAAAGKTKDIRLLHPDQMVCYAEMKGHEHEIACMTFHPRYPTVLFSGDALANILVWDVGVPSAVDYTTKYQLLTRLACPRSHLNPVLNLVVMPAHDVVVAGCEDGIFVWLFPEFRKTEPNGAKREPDFELQVATHQEPCFDGLARLSENTMLVKSVEEGEIFTINFIQILQHFKARKFDEQNRVVADVIGWLRWQITEEIYINVTAQQGRNSVLCGDNEGTIWLYDMTKEMAEEHSCKKFKAKPAKVLDWPECNVDQKGNNNTDKTTVAVKNPIVNCVEMSSDGRFLVAVTDNNLVCIWSVSTGTD